MMLDVQSWRGWFSGLKDLERQMQEHSDYAGDRIVEYYFAEEVVADYFHAHADAKKFRNVRVFYVPAMRPR